MTWVVLNPAGEYKEPRPAKSTFLQPNLHWDNARHYQRDGSSQIHSNLMEPLPSSPSKFQDIHTYSLHLFEIWRHDQTVLEKSQRPTMLQYPTRTQSGQPSIPLTDRRNNARSWYTSLRILLPLSVSITRQHPRVLKYKEETSTSTHFIRRHSHVFSCIRMCTQAFKVSVSSAMESRV